MQSANQITEFEKIFNKLSGFDFSKMQQVIASGEMSKENFKILNIATHYLKLILKNIIASELEIKVPGEDETDGFRRIASYYNDRVSQINSDNQELAKQELAKLVFKTKNHIFELLEAHCDQNDLIKKTMANFIFANVGHPPDRESAGTRNGLFQQSSEVKDLACNPVCNIL